MRSIPGPIASRKRVID
jgi:hypothetical protein